MIRFASMPAFSIRRRVRMLVLGTAALGIALGGASPAMAAPPQAADDEEGPGQVSRPVVEPTAPTAGKALNAALVRLAHDPRNVDALVEAGNAALTLGDNEAALGFFSRADQVSPGNALVKVAIAGARLHLDDPVEALRWYAEAEKAGGDPSAFALDRGLAYDLVGDNTASIAQYRLVLARSRDPVARDEATRRQAVSLAISGDRRAADMALLPLLQRQDRAAWRAHIFVLAIAGRGEEAVGVAHSTMPPELAESIAPYLRFMVRLTPAQQAAVASLGRFPRAADIGRDDPHVMAYAAMHPHAPLPHVPQAGVTPVLARGGPTAAELKAAHKRRGQPVVAAAPTPAPLPDLVLPAPPAPVLMATNSGPVPAPSAGHPPVVVARIAPAAPAASHATSRASGFDLAQTGGDTRSSASGSAAISPRVPQPTVLSKLDMPPPHRTEAVPATRVPTPPITTTYYGPQNSGLVSQSVAATHAPVPGPTMVSSPVVQSTPHVAAELPALPVATSTPVPPSAPTSAPAPTQVAVASSAARFEPPIPEPSTAGPVSGPPVGPPSGNLAIVASPPVPGATESVAPAPKPVPALAEPQVAATHPVVEPVPAPAPIAPPHAKPVPEKAPPEKALREKAAAAQLARDEAKSARDAKGRTKAGKDKAAPADDATDKDKPAKGKMSAKDKLAGKDKKGKAADADEPVLEPCKPAPTAKGRRGKAAGKSESAHGSKSAHGKSRNGKLHEGKGKKHADEDNETCAPVTKGDRPDGPGDVSRDSDNDDSHAAKGKDKDRAKGKHGKDIDADKSDKPEKGGRKAHYASRIWVQVLTGGDRDKMAGEWHAMVRKAHGLKNRKAYLTPWHSNFRLLTGPFDSDAEAQDFIAGLRKDGVSGFEWTSPAGQAIDSLGN